LATEVITVTGALDFPIYGDTVTIIIMPITITTVIGTVIGVIIIASTISQPVLK